MWCCEGREVSYRISFEERTPTWRALITREGLGGCPTPCPTTLPQDKFCILYTGWDWVWSHLPLQTSWPHACSHCSKSGHWKLLRLLTSEQTNTTAERRESSPLVGGCHRWLSWLSTLITFRGQQWSAAKCSQKSPTMSDKYRLEDASTGTRRYKDEFGQEWSYKYHLVVTATCTTRLHMYHTQLLSTFAFCIGSKWVPNSEVHLVCFV